MGLVANLTSGEILEQLAHANRVEKIRNVVFMGMGMLVLGIPVLFLPLACSLFVRQAREKDLQ